MSNVIDFLEQMGRDAHLRTSRTGIASGADTGWNRAQRARAVVGGINGCWSP